MTQHDLVFLASPMTFDPSMVEMFLALSSGASLLLVPNIVKAVPRVLLKMLFYRHRVSILQVGIATFKMVTIQYQYLLNNKVS